MTLPRSEREIRKEIDKTFKPIFSQHDLEGGLPINTVSEMLENSQLPPVCIRDFLRRADLNQNSRISYQEFVQQMTRVDENVYQTISSSRKYLAQAVLAVAPHKKRKPLRRNVDETLDQTDLGVWNDDPIKTYEDAYDCSPPPFFIPLISLSLVGVFVYSVLSNKDLKVTWFEGVDRDSVLIWNPRRRLDLWRYVTYMFVHNGYTHLVFNVVLLLILGTLLELAHKFWRVGLVFLLGVVAGSLAHSMFDAKAFLAGASGGCYAILGAHFATVVINWEEMQRKWLSSPSKFFSSGVFQLLVIIVMAGGDTALSVYSRYWPSVSNTGGQVGFSAHAGGFIAGIIVGIPILRNFDVKQWEIVLFWVCVTLFFVFLIIAFLVNYFCVTYDGCYPLST